MIRCGEPQIGRHERIAVRDVLRSGELTRGAECHWFDEALGDHLGRPALAVSSGTAALHLALLGVGVQPGDEVIVPATTFVATANAVLYCGATPVVVDIDAETWTISVDEVRRHVTKRTKAIVPVHLYGVPADMGALVQFVEDRYRATGQRIALVEDAAEAFGAISYGKQAGSIGDAAAFSFYGSKTITTGEGGAVSWSDHVIGDRVTHLAGQGLVFGERYVHDALGFNYRMTEIQAAIGLAQLARLDEFLDKRAQVFAWYEARLPDKFKRQRLGSSDTHGYWAFAVRRFGMDPRAVADAMALAGVETRPIFPPVTSFPHVKARTRSQPLVAHYLHREGIVLPTHCGLTEDDVETVCQELQRVVSCS